MKYSFFWTGAPMRQTLQMRLRGKTVKMSAMGTLDHQSDKQIIKWISAEQPKNPHRPVFS